MKYSLLLLGVFSLIASNLTLAGEQEEMERMQRQLNNKLFGVGDKPKKEPPPAPARAPIPKPEAKAPAPQAPSDNSTLPLSTFTGYTLAGVSLGMEESAVLAALKDAGYQCNMGGTTAMSAMLGRTICIYYSMEEPKVAHVNIASGRVREIELHEMYEDNFPEELFAQKKATFLKKYGDATRCKTRRRGERCEVFGHGYRISLSSKIKKSGKSSIIRRIALSH